MNTLLRQSLLVCFALAPAMVGAQSLVVPGPLIGRVESNLYVAANGSFRVPIPVLPELGGRITDSENSVTFQDDYTYVFTIASLPIDDTGRRELATLTMREFLTRFFAEDVMPDFKAAFRGAHVESARFAPGILEGALIVYLLLPGGSMFAHKLGYVDPNETLPDAKRGNLLVVHSDRIFILSTEIAERLIERRTYRKTTAEENDLLRQRLVDMLGKIQFLPAPANATESSNP